MNKQEEFNYWPRVVREAIRFGNLTVEALAEKLDVSPREVYYWQAGDRRPTGMIAVRLYEFRCVAMAGTTVHCEQTGNLAMS